MAEMRKITSVAPANRALKRGISFTGPKITVRRRGRSWSRVAKPDGVQSRTRAGGTSRS